MPAKRVRFSAHALLKFRVLAGHGLRLLREQVADVVSNPTTVNEGYRGRKIAQGPLDTHRVLRVIYEERADEILIITFYPGLRERYEKNQI